MRRGPRARDKAARTVKSLSSLLLPSKSHPFPNHTTCERTSFLYVTYILLKRFTSGNGNTMELGIEWVAAANSFGHLRAGTLQGHRVPKVSNTSFQFRCAITLLVLHFSLRAKAMEPNLKEPYCTQRHVFYQNFSGAALQAHSFSPINLFTAPKKKKTKHICINDWF